MTDSPILCFQHCQSGTNTYCVSMPSVCPECSLPLIKSTFKIPPFRPPGPFVCSRHSPYSVVLKPTVGTFLVDYINGRNLHVGVTDSFGITYDFDSHGVNRSFHGWSQVLAVDLADYLDEEKSALWNSKLHEFTGYECWLPERYSEDSFNCYDFVLEFLRLMNLQETLPCILAKLDFCQEMVLPKTTRAAKYIWLYRRILQEGAVTSSDRTT